ncbi:hypothetical protein MPSEU_000683300 [Mayamaea pseudoterrestris]|nr:hypothetical protein MPSEU_000683300 [Mayamaea pseudoterrestris]
MLRAIYRSTRHRAVAGTALVVPRTLLRQLAVATRTNVTHSASALPGMEQLTDPAGSGLIRYRQSWQQYKSASSHWTAVAALALLGGGCSGFMLNNSTTTASCEQVVDPDASSPLFNDNNDDQDEDDLYENLPEEDEETNCSMCQTFRKGPCRPQWRKLERCFKDHEEEDNGAVKCMKYFNPHHQCLAQYTNLYQLVSLEAKQELVQDVQKSVTKDECRSWEPEVDWTMWKRFCAEDNGLYCKKQTISKPKGTPYWQRLPENTEPLLITLSSNLPQQDADGHLLKIAYALDQDGIVIGLSFNSEYGKLLDKANGKKNDDVIEQASTSPSGTDDEKSSSPPSHMELDFVILPGETKRIRVFGLYSENPVLASADKDILDATLYKSPSYSLVKIAKAAMNNS